MPPTLQAPGLADDGYRVFQLVFLRALLGAAGGVSALFVLADVMGINHLGETQLHGTVVYCLPNRRLLDDRLRQTLAEGGRHPQQTFGALMFLDMDHFKEVNDTLGHQGGDALLIEIGRRLRAQVRDSDTVARLGGDEFVILLPLFAPDREAALQGAQTVAGKLLEAVGRPYTVDGKVVARSPSIGLTLFPEPDDTAAAVLQRADAAMYQAKAAGRRCLRVSNHTPERAPAADGDLADA